MTCSPRSRLRPTTPSAGFTPGSSTRPSATGCSTSSYRTIDSPIGPLLLAATPDGLVRVAFDCEDHDVVLAQLADRHQPADPSRAASARRRRHPVGRVLRAVAAERSTYRSISNWRTDSAGRCSPTCVTSPTARRPATRCSPPRPAARTPCGRSEARARTTRSRSSCHATASCAATDRSASTCGGTEAKQALLAMEAVT